MMHCQPCQLHAHLYDINSAFRHGLLQRIINPGCVWLEAELVGKVLVDGAAIPCCGLRKSGAGQSRQHHNPAIDSLCMQV